MKVRQDKTITPGPDGGELAAKLAELSAELVRASSTQEVLEMVGEGLSRMGRRFCAWEASGSLLRLRYENWRYPEEAAWLAEVDDGLLIHLDAGPIPAFFFADKQFFYLQGHQMFRDVVASFRDAHGRKLSEEAIDGLIEAGTPTHGIFGPVFVADAPWGLLAFEWHSPDPRALDLFTLFASQVGAALAVAIERETRSRSIQELELIRTVAPPGPTDGGAAQRRYELLSNLYRLGGSVSLSMDLRGFAREALALLSAGMELEGAWLFSLDRDSLVLEAHGGLGSVGLQAGVERLSLTGGSPCARSMRAREVVSTSGDAVGLPVDQQVTAIPLLAWGRAVGCLAVVRAAARPFDEAEQELLAMTASHVATAIEQVRLASIERQRVRQLRFLSEIGRVASDGGLEKERLLSAFFQQLRQALGFDACLGFFVAGEEGSAATELGSAHMSGDVFLCPEPVVRKAREAAQALLRSPGENARLERADWGEAPAQICALALRTPTETQAIVSLIRREHLVNEQELDTLEAASTHIGFALEYARRFDATRKSLDELKLLLQVSQAITGRPSYASILQTAANIATRLIDASHTFVLLLDDDRRVLRGVATSDPAWSRSFTEVRIPLEEGTLAPRAVTTKGPVLVEDAASTPWVSQERIRRFSEKSILAVPMMLLGEPIGCLVVGDRRGPRRWTLAEVEKITLVADQLAIAGANARLHEDLRSSRRMLEQTQVELLEKERLAALGELSAVIAHEVRNPLGAVFNSLSSLRKLLAPTGDAATLLDVVEEEANRLDEMVAALLDFAKPTPLDLQWVEPGPLAAEVLDAFERDTGVAVERRIDEHLPRTLLDATLIRQALLNLVQNAAQATHHDAPRPRVEVTARTEKGRAAVEIRVCDRGPGIPQELHSKIFEPFFTTKATGTGLGLALVKRIVDAHRGQVAVESWPGVGTTFTLTLESYP